MHHESLPEAVPGDNVGFNVKNVSVKEIRRVWLLETARTIHQRVPKTSLLRLLSSTTLDRSALDTLQFWIATLLTLLANSLNSKKRSTVVQVRRWKTTPSS